MIGIIGNIYIFSTKYFIFLTDWLTDRQLDRQTDRKKGKQADTDRDRHTMLYKCHSAIFYIFDL